MKVLLVHANAKLPTKGTEFAAGWDFYTPEPVVCFPKTTTEIPLGIKVSFPSNQVLIFMEKSGLAKRSGLILKAGVIDADYRGELKVLYYNTSRTAFRFSAGEKVVQGILLYIASSFIEKVDALEDSTRGERGFGSTGRY